MTGRVEMNIPAGAGAPGPVVLEDADKRPDAISLRANEVVGLAGLLGSGTGRVLRRLFGLDAGGATTRVGGEVQRPGVPADAIRSGIGMVPGERRLGLIGNMSVRENILLPSLDRLTRAAGILHRATGDRARR